MADRDLVLTKAASVRRHLNRVIEKRDVDQRTFLNDVDRQESILFNLQMAVQNCIDIAAHIISEEGFGVPGSTNEMFYLLQENGYLEAELTEKMVSAVGFRNLIVHEYGKVDMKEVLKVARKDLDDLNEFLKAILTRLGLANEKGS